MGLSHCRRNLLTTLEGYKYPYMDLFFIRHGESSNNALVNNTSGNHETDAPQRVSDPPLTERGRRQADCLGPFLARGGHLDPQERESGPPLHELFCSPMLRTLETARPAVDALGLQPKVWVDVHEVGGVWQEGIDRCTGLSRADVETQLPGAIIPQEIGTNGWWTSGQETAAAGLGRASAVATELRARAARRHQAGGPAERVAIVSHGDFMSCIVKAFADHLPSPAIYYSHSNTGIDRFRLDGNVLRILYLNRIDHLDRPDLVSP